MTIPKKIKSEFAILDVTAGRNALMKHVGFMGIGDNPNKIPVTITGYIVGVHGNDDGVSREFTIDVTSVKLGAE